MDYAGKRIGRDCPRFTAITAYAKVTGMITRDNQAIPTGKNVGGRWLTVWQSHKYAFARIVDAIENSVTPATTARLVATRDDEEVSICIAADLVLYPSG